MKKIITVLFACFAIIVFTVALTSCGEERNGWNISGTIEGAADSTIYIEEPSGLTWIIVDSLKVDGDNNFDYTAKNPIADGPKEYRLRIGNKSIPFIINGTEAVKFEANIKTMDSQYTLSGTPSAEAFSKINSLINDAKNRLGAEDALKDSALFYQLTDIILQDTTCVVAYYGISQTIDGKPIFNVDDKNGLKIIGAVATNFKTRRPDDPRGKMLEDTYVNAKNKRRGSKPGATMEASLIGRPELNFVHKDNNGKEQDLDAVLDGEGIKILSLTRYDDPTSALNTAVLNDVYSKYKDKGLEIFQIGFDPNEAAWRQNAVRMPWITVYCPQEDYAKVMLAYNADPVNRTYVNFLFDDNGEIIGSYGNPKDLEKEVDKIFEAQ